MFFKAKTLFLKIVEGMVWIVISILVFIKAMHLPEIFGLSTFTVFRTFWTFDCWKYFKNYTDFWLVENIPEFLTNVKNVKNFWNFRLKNSLFGRSKSRFSEPKPKLKMYRNFRTFFGKRQYIFAKMYQSLKLLQEHMALAFIKKMFSLRL